jgi:hypothetical protein
MGFRKADESLWLRRERRNIIKDAAMEEESDNELDNLQLRRNFLPPQEMALQ